MSSEAISLLPRALADSSAQARDLASALDSRSDEELLLALGQGDKQALSLLFQRHARSVFHVAWRILRDETEAHDLRQEVFLYLFERSHLFDPAKGSAMSWIMQVTYHRSFNRRKFLARRVADTLDILEEEVHSSTAPIYTDLIDGKAMLRRIKEELSLPQQKTLEMHFFEGYSFHEIAKETNQTLVNVRHHYYRALDRLRQNLFSKRPGMSERIGNRPHRKGN